MLDEPLQLPRICGRQRHRGSRVTVTKSVEDCCHKTVGPIHYVLGQYYYVFARIRLSVCLSASKISQKRVHRFGSNIACQKMSGHGRTD